MPNENEKQDTYLVLYGSGFLTPTALKSHNAGDTFKKLAEARNKINKKNHPNDICKALYCPTEIEFFQFINESKSIKRLDIYSHGWLYGLNMGGFISKRILDSVEYDSKHIEWDSLTQGSGKDLRRIETHENIYLKSDESNELTKMKASAFAENAKTYFWGCNIGGQLSPKGIHIANNDPYIEDPKVSFAQDFALAMNKGGTTYALVGKGVVGGSIFKTDEKGKNYYEDGEMLPANIAYKYKNINTKSLSAEDYMKIFPM